MPGNNFHTSRAKEAQGCDTQEDQDLNGSQYAALMRS